MIPAPDTILTDIDTLRTALVAEQSARREAEARASGAEAMVAHLKLLIARLKHDKYGASSERGRKLLDQLELELGELVAAASEDAAKVEGAAGKDGSTRRPDSPPRGQPVRAPLPVHLPRERVVLPSTDRLPLLQRQAVQAGRGTSLRRSRSSRSSGKSSRPSASGSRADPARQSPSRRRRSTPSPAAGRGRTCWR